MLVAAILAAWLNVNDWLPVEPFDADVSIASTAPLDQDNLIYIRSPETNQFVTGDGVKVAVIDTGIYGDHPHFSGTNIETYNVISDTVDPEWNHDHCIHGTMTAGVVHDVAPNADILSIKVSRDDICKVRWEYVEEAVIYAVDHGADVISMSIAGQAFGDPIPIATQYALEHNVIIVASSGNNHDDQYLYWPAAEPHAIAVAGMGNNDQTYYEDSNRGTWVDTAAPAIAIWVPFYNYPVHQFEYIGQTGTSFAAPEVAGMIALLLEAKPDLTGEEISQLVCDGSVDVFAPGKDTLTGCGRIDVFNTFKLLVKRYNLSAKYQFNVMRLPLIKVK